MLKNKEYYVAYSKDDDERFHASSGGVGSAIVRHLLSTFEYGTSVSFFFDTNLCMYVPKLIFSEQDINVCGSIYQDIDLIHFVKENVDNIKNGIVLTCCPCQVGPIRAILNRRGIKNFIMSFCCSGQTTIDGTWCYYRFLGINKNDVVNMQYRGNGWPSGIQIFLKNGDIIKKDNWTEPWVSIHQSSLFKPKRCLFCKLDLGEKADLNLADPWLDEYIFNEKKGATLCIINSEKGKKIFENVVRDDKIEITPSSYYEYAIAESPNVHKEFFLKKELLYKKRIIKLIECDFYRKWATKNIKNLTKSKYLFKIIHFFSREIDVMSKVLNLIGKIKKKLRVWRYKKILGGWDTCFSIGKNVVMTGPQCVYLGKNVGIGENTYLGPVTSYAGIAYNPKIIIEEGTWIGKNCSIATVDCVHIGKNVLFAGHVHITDHSHGYEDISIPIKPQRLISKGPIIIEDDCWLGFSCEILSGVHIGKHSIVAARAVVTKNVPAYSIVAGNPAKVIKQYDKVLGKWVRV